VRWIIVDDGSTDQTPTILREYATRFSFISVYRRQDRGHRNVGPGVIDAFYHGYEKVRTHGFDYLCKLDLDLALPVRYFESLMERMEADPRIGSCSGKPYIRKRGVIEPEAGFGDEMSVGASKFYRRQCFDEIGGLAREVMWDGIDCHRARMLGWKVRCWDDIPDLRFVHLRPTGSSQGGILSGSMRHGFGQYFMGTSFLYIMISAIYRSMMPPYIIGGLAIWWGYVISLLRQAPRYDDMAFRSYLRRFQWRCLRYGKSRAVDLCEEEYAARWSVVRANGGSPGDDDGCGSATHMSDRG
jgi:glycosyltransferase involved in cell wall biosynthesis